MKKLLALAFALIASLAQAQTYDVQNLAVHGTASFATAPTSVTPAANDISTKLATTAFVRSVGGCPNIMAYGGVVGGTGDNSGAFSLALAANPTGHLCVFFPPGKFAFATPAAYTFPNASPSSVTIVGSGPDVTEITCASTTQPCLSVNYAGPYNSAHIRDLTITSSVNGTSNQGIFLNQTATSIGNPANTALSDITNVVIRGADGYEINNYFQYGVLVFGVSNINFTNVMVVGDSGLHMTGVQISATSSALGVAYNFVGCTFNGFGNGFLYGSWVQGVTITNSNFTGGTNGILAPSGEPGLDQLTITNSQFNAAANGILIQSPISALMISNNFFLVQNNAAGIQLQNYSQFTITGNTWNPAVLPRVNQTGLILGAWSSYSGVVTGNAFANLTLGVSLQAGSQAVNLQSNTYTSNGTNYNNAGTGNVVGGGTP
jgi:hypothetical protein